MGIVIGVLQVIGLNAFWKMITGGSIKAKALGVFLFFIKIALIVFVVILISSVSLMHVVWTAVGMLLGLIAALAFISMRTNKKKT